MLYFYKTGIQNLAYKKPTSQKVSKGSCDSDKQTSSSKRGNKNSNKARSENRESNKGWRDSDKRSGKRSTSRRRDLGEGRHKSKSGSSSTGKSGGDSGNAVDGIFYETCSHSGMSKEIWWNVDLEDYYNIMDVVIQSNTDCCGRYRFLLAYVTCW